MNGNIAYFYALFTIVLVPIFNIIAFVIIIVIIIITITIIT